MKQYELFDKREVSSFGMLLLVLAILWIATLSIVVYLLVIASGRGPEALVRTQQPYISKGTDEKPNATTGYDAQRFEHQVLRQHLSGSQNDPEPDE